MEITIKKPSLLNRSVSSGAWTLGGHLSIQVFRLAANLVMARLLLPEMFGVMTLANVFIFGLALFSDIGLHHNVVQSKRGNDKSFLDTVWTTQIIRGILIFAMGGLLSCVIVLLNHYHLLPADSAYAHPVFPPVLATLSFISVISGFESTKTATVTRDLAVKQLRIIEFVSHLSGIGFMLLWAWFDRSVWALVFGAFFSVLVKNILSHVALPGLSNSFYWNKDDFREIFGFGKWVFVSSIMGFLCITGDRLLLGGMMTKEMFGTYSIAVLIFATVKEMFSKINSSVVFPALSEVARENPPQLKASYYKFRFASDILLALGAGFIYATAHLIMSILYDERYAESGTMLQILAISLMGFRYEVTNQCFIGMGKPKYQTYMTIANMIALFTLVPIANYYYGVYAALWMIALSSLITIPFVIKLKLRKGIFSWKKELIGLPFLPLGYVIGLGAVALFNWFKV